MNILRICFYDVGTKGPSLLVFIYLQSLFIRNCIMHVMVIERIIATFRSKNYEKHRSIKFHVIWITITVSVNTYKVQEQFYDLG